ncbi:protein NDR1-like [Beta vulgaris subsp. vulgaris]|uniref:protein NDR1-like n=1 Tax=Beta vulgaris subsp. vulgaris TaxID=3555 RepID=UPI002036E64C|nr:protein NDR1-like [Beta vulgaris subsp. vulgaris]
MATLCKKCCSYIFSLGLTALSLWLLLYQKTPTCSIEQFDVFALKETTTTNNNNSNNVHYDLKLKNRIINKGIYYDTLNVTFYEKNNFIGNAIFSPFYQGYHKGTHRVGDIEARGVQWENVTAAMMVFRVELATAVRYKHLLWKSKRHHLVVGADLKVNDQGSLVKGKGNKGITLISKAGNNNNKSRFELLGMLDILVFIHFL